MGTRGILLQFSDPVACLASLALLSRNQFSPIEYSKNMNTHASKISNEIDPIYACRREVTENLAYFPK